MWRKPTKLLLPLLFLFTYSFASAQTATIAGYVKDAKTQEPLFSATVFIEGTDLGTFTDENGYYKIENVPTKTYNIKASYVGYNDVVKYNIVLTSGNTVFVSFELEEKVAEIKGTVITANPYRKNVKTPLSSQTLSTQEIKSYPGGNNDIAKVVQSLPGVSGSVGFRNDIIIRGGAPNENVYYLDGIEIPNINHFATQGSAGGPVGMLNVSFIDDVTLSTSAFDAKYDNPLSGVLQFKQRTGNPEKFQSNLRLGASEFAFTNEGPISEKVTYIASIRRSYLQLLFKLIDLPFLPSYWDYQYKINFKLDKKNELNIIGLGSIDNFTLNPPTRSEEDTEEDYLERLAIYDAVPINTQWTTTHGIQWKHIIEGGYLNIAFSKNILNNQAQKYEGNQNGVDSLVILDYKSVEDETKLRLDVNKFSGKWRYSYGTNLQYSTYTNNTLNRLTNPVTDSNGNVIQPAIIIDYNTDIGFFKYGLFGNIYRSFFTERLDVNLGIRTDGNTYTDNGNDLINRLAPRLAVSYKVTPKFNINASVGRYYKIAPYTILGFKNNAGEYVNKDAKYIQSNHYVAGIEYLANRSSRITLEGFYKQYSNYPVSVRDSISLANLGGDFGILGNEDVASVGLGRTYGMELTFQKKFTKNYYAIVAYTYYISEYTAFDKDKYIASSWDNRHLVSLTGGYKFKKNWEVGARFRYLGPAPYTPYDYTKSVNNYTVTGSGNLDYSRINTERLPAFNQLDIRVDKIWNFKKSSLDVYLDIQNVLSSANPSAPTFTLKRDTDQPDGFARDNNGNLVGTLIANNSGTLLPTIGLIFEF